MTKAPIWLRIVGVLAIAWNMIGVFTYLGHVGAIPSDPPPDTAMPAMVTAAFAIGVFGGVLGSFGLALLQRWARPVLWISFIGTAVDWAWVFSASNQASVPLGVTVLIVSFALALLGDQAARRGWLR